VLILSVGEWTSTTCPLPEVVEAMQRCLVEACGNSASNHRHGRLADALHQDGHSLDSRQRAERGWP